MTSVLILSGPNLNLLGSRQPEVYGKTTLAEIEKMCREFVQSWGWDISHFQSNHEGVLIDALHAASSQHDGIILNAGAYTHTSIALMDAVASIDIPVIEVHLSNIAEREPFRRISYISHAAVAQICGMGAQGYLKGLEILAEHLGKSSSSEHADAFRKSVIESRKT